MSSGTGPSGRSPFPGNRGGRRSRTSDAHSNAAMDESNNSSGNSGNAFTSPLVMGNLLSSSRLSPAAASGWSPMNSASNSTSTRSRPRRFFDDARKSTDGGVLATAIPSASMGNNTTKSSMNGAQQMNHADINEDEVMDGMNLSKIRNMAQNSTQNPSSMGVFYASILYSKTRSTQDAFLYAQALSVNGQAMRAVRILEHAGLLLNNSNGGDNVSLQERLEAILLAASCLFTMGEWQEALTLLESATQNTPCSILEDDDEQGWASLAESIIQSNAENQIHPVARLALLRGRAYNETSNPTRAALYWKRALKIDAKCVEAFDLLLNCNMLTPQEAHGVVTSLSIQEEFDWLRHYYLARISVPSNEEPEEYSVPTTPSFAELNGQHQGGGGVFDASSIQMATPSGIMATFEGKDENNVKLPPKVSIFRDVTNAFELLFEKDKLDKAPEALALAAVKCYRQYNLKGALEYCKQLSEIDPLCPTASFVYVATLLALDCKRLLFQLAHEWVEAFPKSAHAWFAVGSYYYACGRYHVAQRHFCRATRLDPQCTEAWIAFGCSFAMSDETDQALASFRAAQRLAPAHHVPLLYMGMEYLRTNHLVLARHFLMAAQKTSGGDPLCLHELGVADYQRKEYATAAVWFQRSLAASASRRISNNEEEQDVVELCQDAFWEPTLFNLGQCYRKQRQFAEATRCFEKCLSLCPVCKKCANAISQDGCCNFQSLTYHIEHLFIPYHREAPRVSLLLDSPSTCLETLTALSSFTIKRSVESPTTHCLPKCSTVL